MSKPVHPSNVLHSSNQSRHQTQFSLQRSSFWQKAIVQGLLITSPLWGLIRPVVAAPTPPGTIDNTATGSFIDTSTDGTVEIFSNTVTVTVVEVAGITVTFDSAREATTGEAGVNAGPYQGFDGINEGDVAYFDFVITNVGNDPTAFFIPNTPSSVTGATFDSGTFPIQIIAVDPDGAGATPATSLSVNVTTADDTIALLGATNGYIPPDGTVTVRVPVTVTESIIGNPINVVLGNTGANDNSTGTQNQDTGTAPNGNDVITQDLPNSTTVPAQAGYTGTTPETDGTPVIEKEASALGTTPLQAAYQLEGFKSVVLTTDADSSSSITEGDTMTWTIFYVNTGTGSITDLQITDDLGIPGDGLTYVANSLTIQTGNTTTFPTTLGSGDPTLNATYDGDTTSGAATDDEIFSSTLPTLAPNEIIQVNIAVTIDDLTPDTRTENNQAAADGNEDGVDPIVTVLTDNVDNTTTGLATNVTVPANSIVQTQAGTIDPTTFDVISPTPTPDYGDAPDTGPGTGPGNYQTTSSDGGPSHDFSAVPGLRLGTAIDGDNGTLQNAAADADGADEDGVASFPALDNRPAQIYNVTVSVTNSTGSNAYLVGYIDFNGDGDFDDTYEQSGIDLNWDGDFLDAGEQVGTVLVPSNATNPRDFTVTFVTPSGMKTGTTYARFRLSNTQSEVESPIGAATSGEVEDYSLTVTDVSQGPTFLCDPSFYIVTGSRNVPRTSQLYRINRSTSPYSFDPIGVATIQGNLATDITYPTNFNVNAIGYNLTQDYIYGIIEGSDRPDTTPFDIPYRAGNIVRIDANGRVFDLGTPRQSGNPIIDIEIGNGAPSGAVLADGTTYVLGKEEANDNNDPQGIYLIDITQTPPTFTKSGDLPGYLNDIFLNPLDTTTNRIYTIPENDSNNQPNRLSYFDVSNPTSGLQSFATNTTGLTVNYGSQYVDSFGTVYFRSATNNNLYYLGDTGANQILDGAPAGGNHDGTSCPSVELRKAASPSSIPVGNNVTYTYQIANARLTPVTLTFRDQLDSVIDYAATVADEAAAQVGNVATFIGTGSGDLTALAVTSDSVTVVNGSVNTSIAISQAAINSGTTTFSNTNRTLEISGMTIPAQSLVSFSVDVNIPSGATPQNYYNQAELQNPTDGTSTSLPAQILSDSFTTAFFQDPTQITVTPSVATNPDLWLIRV